MAILHDAPGSTARNYANIDKGNAVQAKMSSPHKNYVGSGSRPTKAMHPIHTSSPHHPRKLDSRHVPGALGVDMKAPVKRPTAPHKGMKMKSK